MTKVLRIDMHQTYDFDKDNGPERVDTIRVDFVLEDNELHNVLRLLQNPEELKRILRWKNGGARPMGLIIFLANYLETTPTMERIWKHAPAYYEWHDYVEIDFWQGSTDVVVTRATQNFDNAVA